MSNNTNAKSEAKAARADNPMLQLRKVLGLKQVDFAARVAISPSQIASVEIGRRAITPDFAWQVAARTGVDPQCLRQEGGVVRDQKGRTYSKQSYVEHLRPCPIDLKPSGYDELLAPLRLTMQAAAETGRLGDFTLKLREFVERLIHILPGLQEAVERRLERQSGARFSVTAGQLRNDRSLAVMLFGEQFDRELHGLEDHEVVYRRQSEPLAALWQCAWYRPAESLSNQDR
jgi:transcriptional regulator with XRE-family HTH domain